MKRIILLLGVMILLSGCATTFYKPGATQASFARDKDYCQSYSSANAHGRTLGGEMYNQIQQFFFCMKEKGYERK